MCVLFHAQLKLSLFLWKTVRPQIELLIFFKKKTHSETKSRKSSRISSKKKSYNNNGQPWKSMKILLVKRKTFKNFGDFAFSFAFFFMFHHFVFNIIFCSFFFILSFYFIFHVFLSCFLFFRVLKIWFCLASIAFMVSFSISIVNVSETCPQPCVM